MSNTIAHIRDRVRCSRLLRSLVAVAALLALLSATLPSFAPGATAVNSRKSPKSSGAGADDHLVQSYAKLPLNFEPNQGQMKSAVKFVAHSASGDLYLTTKEITFNLPMPLATPEVSSSQITLQGKGSDVLHHSHAHPPRLSDAVRMKLSGAHPTSISGVDQASGTVNYFIGNDPKSWRTNIRTYRKVRYQDVYPGIDQIFYGNGEQLEYDFIVSPGANPGTIEFGFKGQRDVAIDASGDLILRARHSQEIRLHKPFAYQEINSERREVSARYVIRKKHEVAFEIGDYNSTKKLIIDPVLSYSTYLGGSGNDAAFDIAVGSDGSAFVTGSTDSSEFSPLGGTNGFVAKLSPDGTQRTYLAIIGGSGDDTGFSIALDNAGAAYVTGATNSVDFPVATSFQSSFGGGSQDAFVAKLSPDGSSIVYASYFGGSGNDAGFGVAVDSSGSAYVTGSTDSPELSTLGNTDVFVTKLSPAGNARVYSCILGGSGDDTGFDIAVDGQGSAYIVGSTDSTDFKTANALQPNFGGAQDAFVAKLSPDGSSLVYSTYLGGTGNDSGFGVAVDSAGNAYVTGSTDSPEFTTLGGRDVFVAKLNAAGTERTYFTILGGSGDDAGFDIAIDSAGNAYVTGSTDSSNFTIANPLQANPGGSQEAFLAKLDPAGSTLSYSTLLGGSQGDSGFAIVADSGGNAFITGFTSSSNFPTVSPYQSASGGNGDAFVLKVSGAETSTPTPTPSPTQSPTPTPTPSPTPSSIQLMLDQSGPALDQVAALDSLLFLRDPFPVVNSADVLNLGVDRNTRVIIFVTNLQLAQGETSSAVIVNLVDNNNQNFDVAAEDVRFLSSIGFTQVIFRLPNSLGVGTCTIRVKAHSQTSNRGSIRIRI